jgi:hypothetical protein
MLGIGIRDLLCFAQFWLGESARRDPTGGCGGFRSSSPSGKRHRVAS